MIAWPGVTHLATCLSVDGHAIRLVIRLPIGSCSPCPIFKISCTKSQVVGEIPKLSFFLPLLPIFPCLPLPLLLPPLRRFCHSLQLLPFSCFLPLQGLLRLPFPLCPLLYIICRQSPVSNDILWVTLRLLICNKFAVGSNRCF